MCDDYFPKLGKILSFKKPKKIKKVNVLSVFILALCAGLFFSVVLESDAHTENIFSLDKVNSEVIDPMERIGVDSVNFNDPSEKACKSSEGLVLVKNEIVQIDNNEEKLAGLVAGYPIEEMTLEISKKEKIVAAFLIGIAKKESDWGKHSPKKNGRDCYNYWGYKGGYNLTASGYSCFDNPEQAVAMVGGRIEELVGKKINTPERMVVWKCGSSCAGHDPGGVRKWISDVGSYFYKLNS
ncbi:MAG: hypothetical protein QG620_250 [Patescibacteria group bacterium]|nr:hypothetical protein [Patescibacteria group bacterium]